MIRSSRTARAKSTMLSSPQARARLPRTAMSQVLLAGAGFSQTRPRSASIRRIALWPPSAVFQTGSVSVPEKKAPLPVYSG